MPPGAESSVDGALLALPGQLPRIPPRAAAVHRRRVLPTPGVTPFHDPRQHAVSLAYVVHGQSTLLLQALAHLGV
jgi:hypothetical protein